MARELVIEIKANSDQAHASFQTLDADIDKVATTAAKTSDAIDQTSKTITTAEQQAAKLDETMRRLSGGALTDAAQAHTKLSEAVTRISGETQDLFEWVNRGGKSWSEYASMASAAWDVLRAITWADIRAGLAGVGEAAGLTVANLGLLGSAGAVMGAGYAGWNVGRMIADFLGLDDAIGRATARLVGFGNVGAQEKGAGQDVINLAIARGANASTSFTDAMKFNEQWVKNMKEGASEMADIDARRNAPEESAKQIAAWHAEIAKVATAGTLPSLTKDLDSHIFSLKELADRYRVSAGALSLYTKELHPHEDAVRTATQQTDAHSEAQHRLANELLKVEHNLTAIPDSLTKIGRSYDESKLGKIVDDVAKVERTAYISNFGYEGMTDSMKNVGTPVIPTPNEKNGFADYASPGQPGFTGPVQQFGESLGEQLKGGLAKSLGTVPQMIAQAFTSGQGLLQAAEGIGTMVGSQTGKIIGKTISALGKFGGPIGEALGSLAGPLIDWIANIGGPSQQELSGRQVEGSFEQSFGGFQKMMDAVGAAYAATGRTAQQAQADVKALLDAEKQGGPAVQDMINKINLAFDAEKAHAKEVSTAVDGILSTAKTVGGSFPAAMKPMVDQLLKLPGLSDAAKNALLALTTKGPNYKELTETAKGYGLSVSDLGPQFQQANVSERADTFASDYRNLTEAGADGDKVLSGMAKGLRDLVNDALKFGSTLPTALQPLTHQLLITGQLTDDSGKKLDNLSGLKFDDTNDPLAKGMADLTAAIEHLSQLLSPNGLPADATKAAADIGKALGGIKSPDVGINVHWNEPSGTPFNGTADGDPRFQAALGGLVTDEGIQRFAGGGRVLPWPMASGTDTVRALLTPGEMVLNQDQQDVLFGGQNTGFSGGIVSKYPDGLPPLEFAPNSRTGSLPRSAQTGDGGGDTFVVTVNVTGDAASVEQFFQRNKVAVARAFNEAVRLNKGGTYTRARGALGLAS